MAFQPTSDGLHLIAKYVLRFCLGNLAFSTCEAILACVLPAWAAKLPRTKLQKAQPEFEYQ